MRGVVYAGASAALKYRNLHCRFTYSVMLNLDFRVLDLSLAFGPGDLCRRHSQVGSLAGAVHLLNANAGVLR